VNDWDFELPVNCRSQVYDFRRQVVQDRGDIWSSLFPKSRKLFVKEFEKKGRLVRGYKNLVIFLS
jgi:hypothetical protein